MARKTRWDSIIGVPNRYGVVPIRTLHKDLNNGNLLYEFICPLCNSTFQTFGSAYVRQKSCGAKCPGRKPNYKDPLYSAYVKTYNIRGDAWHKFEEFKRDVKEIPAGKFLARIDKKKKLGPDNFMFAVSRPGVSESAEVVARCYGIEITRSEAAAILQVTLQRIGQLVLDRREDAVQKRIDEIPYDLIEKRLDAFYEHHRQRESI